jgi:hypothetical protein
MTSFPKALETAAPSDRGVVPLRVPVASILVRYSVASTPSQAGNDGWARVRYTSCGPSPFLRQGRAGFLNWFGDRLGVAPKGSFLTFGFSRAGFPSRWQRVVRYSRCTFNLFGPFQAARRFFCTLRQLRQEARGVLSVLFSPYLSVRFIHATKHGASDVRKIRFPSGEIRNVVR